MITAVCGQRARTCSASQMPSWTGIITSQRMIAAGSASIVRQRIVGVAGFLGLISPSVEPSRQQLPDGFLIVDDQHVSHRRCSMIAVRRTFAYHLAHANIRNPFEVHTMRAIGLVPAAIAALACGVAMRRACRLRNFRSRRFASRIISSSWTTRTCACSTSPCPASTARSTTSTRTPISGFRSAPATLRAINLGSQDVVDSIRTTARSATRRSSRTASATSSPRRSGTSRCRFRDATTSRRANRSLATPKPTGYQAAVPLDNELVRVERLILEPGQSTGRYTLPKSGILIAGHDGTVSVEVPGHRREAHRDEGRRLRVAHGPADPHHHQRRHDAIRGHRSRLEVDLSHRGSRENTE